MAASAVRVSLGTLVSVAWSVSHTHCLGPPEVTFRLRRLFLYMQMTSYPNHLRLHLRAFSGPRSMLCPLAGWTESFGELMPFRSTPQITRSLESQDPSNHKRPGWVEIAQLPNLSSLLALSGVTPRYILH